MYYTLLYIAIYTHSSYVLYIIIYKLFTLTVVMYYTLLYIAIYTHSSYEEEL